MRTGGASWLMPFMVLSLYSIANNSVLFSAVHHAQHAHTVKPRIRAIRPTVGTWLAASPGLFDDARTGDVDRCGTSVCMRIKRADTWKLLNQAAERRNCSPPRTAMVPRGSQSSLMR